MHVFREAMQIGYVYPCFGFICFLKGHDLHSGSLSISPCAAFWEMQNLWGENWIPGSGFWEIFKCNSHYYHQRRGSPVPPTPAKCLQGMDYLPLGDSMGDILNGLCMLAGKCSRQTWGRVSSCVLQQRSAGIESGSQNVNPMYPKEIKGSTGTKCLFKSFQLL